jgi:hypothetical protein
MKGRKTCGRKKGSKNHTKPAKQAELEQTIRMQAPDPARAFTPLEALLWCMHQCLQQGDRPGVLAAAREAAPYVHSKLASTETKIHHTFAMKTDAELAEELCLLEERIRRTTPRLIEHDPADA